MALLSSFYGLQNTISEASIDMDRSPPGELIHRNTVCNNPIVGCNPIKGYNTKQFVRSPGADPQRLHKGSVTKTAEDVEQFGIKI